jgi:drug/metabolite transporter (DMT)-like permease
MLSAAGAGNAAREYVLLLVLAILWGASYTFIKLGVATIPPVTLIVARTLIAGGILSAMLSARGIAMPRDVSSWRRFMFQALLNSVIPFTLIAWAEKTVEAGLTAILCSTSPIFTFLITFAMTRHEPVTLTKLLGVVTGIGGICRSRMRTSADHLEPAGRRLPASGQSSTCRLACLLQA